MFSVAQKEKTLRPLEVKTNETSTIFARIFFKILPMNEALQGIFNKVLLLVIIMCCAKQIHAQNRADIVVSYASADYNSNDEELYYFLPAFDLLRLYPQVRDAMRDGFRSSNSSAQFDRIPVGIRAQHYLQVNDAKGQFFLNYGVEQYRNFYSGSTDLGRMSTDGAGNTKLESMYYLFSIYHTATQVHAGMGYNHQLISFLKGFHLDAFASVALNMGVMGRVYIKEELHESEFNSNSNGSSSTNIDNNRSTTQKAVPTERLISLSLGIKQAVRVSPGLSIGAMAALRYDGNITGRELLIDSQIQHAFAEFGVFVRF